MLDEDEKIILDDGPVGYRRKLTLTNKRLIFLKKKGVLTTSWVQEDEIPLEEIEEAYVEPGGAFFSLSTAWLKMKNQEPIELGLKLSDSQMLGTTLASDQTTDMTLRIKTVNDRWVNAINNQLNRNRIEQLTSGIVNCPTCGKEIPKGNFVFCPFCGNSLRP
jgi:hypothetical protein